MKGNAPAPARDQKMLSIFHPAGGLAGVLKTDENADDLAQATQLHYRQLGLGGENVVSAQQLC